MLLVATLSGSPTAVGGYQYVKGPVKRSLYDSHGPFPCPGLYCGRSLYRAEGAEASGTSPANGSDSGQGDNDDDDDEELYYYSGCGRCPRGWRIGNNTHSICEPCGDEPARNDWFFLAFHVVVVLVLHWVAVDHSARRRCFTRQVLIVHVCALVEVATAALLTLLVAEPRGSLSLASCRVETVYDWYTFLQNPTPNYSESLSCTQEAGNNNDDDDAEVAGH